MRNGVRLLIGILVILVCRAGDACAEVPAVKAILQRADRARGNVEGVVWDITITSHDEENVETRGMTVKAKGDNTLARYTSPPNMNDRLVLMRDRNMWFIRAGLKKPVSISPRQKLMGDAANGDIASTNYAEDYEASLAGEDTARNESCFVLELKAANKSVSYDRIRYWISRERHVGVKAEFFTLSGKLLKTAEFIYGNRITLPTGEVIPFISELIIHDALRKDRVTTLAYSNIKVQQLPDSTFNLNVLIK